MPEPTAEQVEAADNLFADLTSDSFRNPFAQITEEHYKKAIAQFLADREVNSGWNFNMSEAPSSGLVDLLVGEGVLAYRQPCMKWLDSCPEYPNGCWVNEPQCFCEEDGEILSPSEVHAFKLITLQEVKL